MELVDISDLKSEGLQGPCWFESSSGHHSKKKSNKHRYTAGFSSFVATKTCYEMEMDMSKPKGMFRRGEIWWARKDVPKVLQKLVGVTSLQKSLETADQQEATIRFHGVMQAFEKIIDNARKQYAGDPLPTESIIGTTFAMKLPDWTGSLVIGDRRPPKSMQSLFEQWKVERRPAQNTAAEYERAMELFIALNEDRPVSQYTVDHARAWKNHVIAMKRDGKPLAQSTLEKWFGALVTLFRFADRNDYLSINPFAKVTLERPKRPKASRRQEWYRDDLRVLFSSPVYSEHERPRAAAGEAAYWLPVLALYHGFRAGELCQLDKADLVHRDGIPCLRVRPSTEDDEGPEKSIKTVESERVVPLHKTVIALGFLKYVKSVKGAKLFSLIKPDTRGRWSGYYSKWFGRYRRSIGLDERWTDFHSFRHTWKTAARGTGMPEDYHDEISGHDSVSVGRSYGRIPVPTLKKALDRVRFDVSIPKWRSAYRRFPSTG